jgi:hypothetical protein
MKTYVFSYEYFANCPAHEGGMYHGLKTVGSEEELLEFALKNLNYQHILDVLVIDGDDEIEFDYESESHRYCGIKFFRDADLVKRTVDDGSGNLIWKDV